MKHIFQSKRGLAWVLLVFLALGLLFLWPQVRLLWRSSNLHASQDAQVEAAVELLILETTSRPLDINVLNWHVTPGKDHSFVFSMEIDRLEFDEWALEEEGDGIDLHPGWLQLLPHWAMYQNNQVSIDNQFWSMDDDQEMFFWIIDDEEDKNRVTLVGLFTATYNNIPKYVWDSIE